MNQRDRDKQHVLSLMTTIDNMPQIPRKSLSSKSAGISRALLGLTLLCSVSQGLAQSTTTSGQSTAATSQKQSFDNTDPRMAEAIAEMYRKYPNLARIAQQVAAEKAQQNTAAPTSSTTPKNNPSTPASTPASTSTAATDTAGDGLNRNSEAATSSSTQTSKLISACQEADSATPLLAGSEWLEVQAYENGSAAISALETTFGPVLPSGAWAKTGGNGILIAARVLAMSDTPEEWKCLRLEKIDLTKAGILPERKETTK